MTDKKYYHLVNKFSHLETEEETIAMYPKMFKVLCKRNFRLNKRLIKDLFQNLGYGNWEHLWETDCEKLESVAEMCEMLRWEVWYCSDRMSWDRLLRTHWIWQRIQHRNNFKEDKEWKIGL